MKTGDYITRDGTQAKVLLVVPGQIYSVIGAVLNEDDLWVPESWCDGGVYNSGGYPHRLDLMGDAA